MEEKSDELVLVKAEEDSESNDSTQGSEEVSNDLDQSGSSIQGSEGVKDYLSQSDSSHQGSETGKYNKIKDENANIKTLLGKRPARLPGLPDGLLSEDNKGIKKHCDNSNKPDVSGLPVISDVWSEKNPTELSGLFGNHSNNKPDKHKVEKEWQETFKLSELPDPSVLFGNLDEKVFKKPTKPAPIPLAKVLWRPPVLTGENSLDEKLLPGTGPVAQSVTSGGFKPPSPLGNAPCSFLKYDSFNTCGGSVICMNQTGKPDSNPALPHAQSSNPAVASKQGAGQKLPVGMPQSHAAHQVQKKVLKKLDKPEKSHINRVIKHASAPARSSSTRPKSTSAQPRNTNPRPRNTPSQPRPANTPRKQQAKQEKRDVPMVVPPIEHGMDPPQQFEFTLGSHYTGGNTFCARKVDAPANQMIVPHDFIKGLMKTTRASHIDPAVDIVTRNDIKRFLSVPERRTFLCSYSEPKMEPLPSSVAPHSAIKALLCSRSPMSPGVPSPSELRVAWAAMQSRSSSSTSSSVADAKFETQSSPSPRSLPSPGKDPKSGSKPTSPSFAEKIAEFKAEIPLKKTDTSGSTRTNLSQPSASGAHHRNTIETDVMMSTGIDEKRKSWLNSDSLLPPNMPLFLNTSEKKDASLVPKPSSDYVCSSPRTESVASSSSLQHGAPLQVEAGSHLPPNYPSSLESPGKQSMKSPQSVGSPRKMAERPMVSPEVLQPMLTNIGCLLPPGMPWQLESPEKRPIAPSALAMELPRAMSIDPQLPPNMPWSFSSVQTSRNLQYNIQLPNTMKRNVINPAPPNFPKPFVPIMMPASPEIPRMKQTSHPSATVTRPAEKSQPSDISPSRSKDDGYSTSSSLQESPDNRIIMLAKTNCQSSPSGARKATPQVTPHICYSPKKRRFIPLTPEQQRPCEAEIRGFYNMAPHVTGHVPIPQGLETLPSPHHSPLRRNFELAEPVRQIPYDRESLLTPIGSPYRRTFEPSEPAYNVQLLGITPLPLAGGVLAPNPGNGARAGDFHAMTTSGTDGRIVCAADSTEEGSDQPLNLVVTKPRVESELKELPKPRYEQRAVDLRLSPCESAIDLRVNKHESEVVRYRTQYHHETYQNIGGSSHEPTVRFDSKVHVDASRGHLEPSGNELEVAKDSGVDVVNHFLQSMHSIRYKGETSAQNSTRESENGAVKENMTAPTLNQGDSQDYELVQHQDSTAAAGETDTEGKSQDEKQDRQNGTVLTEHFDSKNTEVTLVESDNLDYEVSALTEVDLDMSKGRSHGDSVSTVASDCHFCTVPGQDETSLAGGLTVCPPSDIENVQHGNDADMTEGSLNGSSTSTILLTTCPCSEYSCSCSNGSENSKILSQTKSESQVAKNASINGVTVLTHVENLLHMGPNNKHQASENNAADSPCQKRPGSILGHFDQETDMTYNVKVLATFSVDSREDDDRCKTKLRQCGMDSISAVDVELGSESEERTSQNSQGQLPDSSIDSEMEFEVAAEWCVNPEQDHPKMTEESSTDQPTLNMEAAVDPLPTSRGSVEPVADVQHQQSRLAPFISSLIQSMKEPNSVRVKSLGSWGDQNSEKEGRNILGKRHRASSPVVTTSLHTQDKASKIRKVESSAQEGIQEEFTKFRTKKKMKKTGDDFDKEGAGYSTKFETGNSVDGTSSSDDSNLVIDESLVPSGDDSNHGNRNHSNDTPQADSDHGNSNHGKDTAQAVSDNLFLLAAVSTEYCKSQQQPISENEQNKQEKNAFSQNKQLSQIKVKQEFSNVQVVEIGGERGLYSCRRKVDAAPEYKFKQFYGFNTNKQQERQKSKRYRAVSAGGGRQLLPEWIEQQVDLGDIPGLQWVDRREKIVRIPWRHSRSTSWKHDDCMLFERWAIHTCKHVPGDAPNPKRWKTNFRCALNLYAVRMDHGKDYCCYKLYETAISGTNNNNRRDKKTCYKTPHSGTRLKNRSGLDEVLNNVTPQIPTVIFDLEEKERVKFKMPVYPVKGPVDEDAGSHSNSDNDDGYNAGAIFKNMKDKPPIESTLVKKELDSSNHGNGNGEIHLHDQPKPPEVSLVSRKQDTDNNEGYYGNKCTPPVAKGSHLLFPRKPDLSPRTEESIADVAVDSYDDSNSAPLNLSLKK
ncbi:uncharacterized protein LOC135502259 [Lineus longissimus]|uniref:uncharacterized protein LOC135502259 n=1 Tax=Lineus longissimus TaxID=88925 RepID=UPI00315C5C18